MSWAASNKGRWAVGPRRRAVRALLGHSELAIVTIRGCLLADLRTSLPACSYPPTSSRYRATQSMPRKKFGKYSFSFGA